MTNIAQIALAASGRTQAEFSRTYHIPDRTLRKWLSGERVPKGPSFTLLASIAHRPEMMATIISGAFPKTIS
jgi:putative transcriptional regulator